MLSCENLSESRNDLSSQEFSELFSLLDIKEYALDEVNINSHDTDFSLIYDSQAIDMISRSSISKYEAESLEIEEQFRPKPKPEPFECLDVLNHLENMLRQAKCPKSYYCDGHTYTDVDQVPFNDDVLSNLTYLESLKFSNGRIVPIDNSAWYAKMWYIVDCSNENMDDAVLTVTKRDTIKDTTFEHKFKPLNRWSPEGKKKKADDNMRLASHLIETNSLVGVTSLTFTLSPYPHKYYGMPTGKPLTYMQMDRKLTDVRIDLNAFLARILRDRKKNRKRGRPRREVPLSTIHVMEAHKSAYPHIHMVISQTFTPFEQRKIIAYLIKKGCDPRGIKFGTNDENFVTDKEMKQYEKSGIFLKLRDAKRLRQHKNRNFQRNFQKSTSYIMKTLSGSIDDEHSKSQKFLAARIQFRNKRCNIEYTGIRMTGVTGDWHKVQLELRKAAEPPKADYLETLKVIFSWCGRDVIVYQHPDYKPAPKPTIDDVITDGKVKKERVDLSTIDPSTVTKGEYLKMIFDDDFLELCKRSGIDDYPDELLLDPGQSFKSDKAVSATCSPTLPPINRIRPGIRIYRGTTDNGILLPVIRRPKKVDISQVSHVPMPISA